MRRSAFLVGLLVALVVAGVFAMHRTATLNLSFVERLERNALDLRFRNRGERPAGDEVVIVALDDRTMTEAPELFERRAGQAAVIDALAEAGAAVIGIDLLYADPEQLLDPALIADIDSHLDAGPEPTPSTSLLGRVADEVHGDALLVEAISSADNVVLALHIGQEGNPANERDIARGKFGQVSPGPYLPDGSGRVLSSDGMFTRKAERLGLMTTFRDLSGSERTIPMAMRLGASAFPTLAVQLVAQLDGVSRAKVAYLGETGEVHIGDRVIRADSKGRSWLNYRGRAPFVTVSAVDVVEGRVDADQMRGRIALVGFTHLAQDRASTPFGSRPGPEVHATAVDNILRGDPLVRASPMVDGLLTLLAGLVVALLFLPSRAGASFQIAGSALAIVGTLGATQVLFVHSNLWISAIGPIASGSATALACLTAAYLWEGLQRRRLRQSFAHYLSDDLVEELARDPSRVSLRGDRRELTVVFTDIRDFTSISEDLTALELADFLNSYFRPMTSAVLDNAGYVDKFIGDALMAIFGAPVPRESHAQDACHAVLQMHKSLQTVRAQAQEGGIGLAVGAGINTGEMVVGNMGSEERFDYTVLGDAVNLASRIEGLTKRYGVFCLVGSRTVEAAGGAFIFRAIDLVRVKGKTEPAELHELCSGPDITVSAYAGVEIWNRALAAYRSGDFEAAKVDFGSFHRANPEDPVAALYLRRLEAMPEVPERWDGVYIYTEK